MDIGPNMCVSPSGCVCDDWFVWGAQLSISEVIAARSTLQGWYAELAGDGVTEAARRARAADREAEAQSYAQRIADLEAEVVKPPAPSGSSLESRGIHSTGSQASNGQNAAPDMRPVAKQFRHVL
jgi:hypothetical protein|eukprot:COSAG02_NODE_5939_length_3927_cov_2.253135_3_plen_125_part_00